MNGGVLVFHLPMLLFGRRWLSAVLYLSGQLITPQQGHRGLRPAASSAPAAPFAGGWPLASGWGRISLITGALCCRGAGTQGRKITSTMLKLLTRQQEFIDHAHKLLFSQKPPFCAVNSIFFRADRLLNLRATNVFCDTGKERFLDTFELGAGT